MLEGAVGLALQEPVAISDRVEACLDDSVNAAPRHREWQHVAHGFTLHRSPDRLLACRQMSLVSLENRQANGQTQRIATERLLDELRDCALELERTPGARVFDGWLGRRGAQLLAMRFGSWSAACTAAGLTPNPRCASPRFGEPRYTDADIKRAYTRIRHLAGGPPSLGEWSEHRRPDEPSSHTLRRRYRNSWIEFLRAMQ